MSGGDNTYFGLTAARGTKVEGHVWVGELNNSTALSMPVRILVGSNRGPVVGMSGMLHGDEYNGYAVINRLFDELDASEVNGTLIGLPVANPFALMTNSRASQIEYERLNLNRVFPGDPNGFQMERLAHIIFDQGVMRSDVWLDFHEGGRDFIARYLIVGAESDDEMLERNLELARWFGEGVPVTVVTLTPDLLRLQRAGSITVQARNEGKLALGIELGGGGTLWPEFVELGVRGARRVLVGLGVLPGTLSASSSPQHICFDSTWPRPSRSGFFEQDVALGEVVREGQVIGRVRDVFGRVVEQIKAPFDAVITDTRHTATVQTGEWTLKCARLDSQSARASK